MKAILRRWASRACLNDGECASLSDVAGEGVQREGAPTEQAPSPRVQSAVPDVLRYELKANLDNSSLKHFLPNLLKILDNAAINKSNSLIAKKRRDLWLTQACDRLTCPSVSLPFLLPASTRLRRT